MSVVRGNIPVDYPYEQLPPVPVFYGYAGVVFSVLFFQTVNQVISRIGYPDSVKKDQAWKWRNLYVSWIHAVIVGVWDLSSFVLYPEMMTDLIAYHNLYIYFMVTFSVGYFVYDFIDLIVSGQVMKMWELIPHHISVAGTFFYNVVQSRCLAFNVIALLAEVNSIFLHARKLLQMSGVPYDRLIYRANAALNLFTFVSCRFLGCAWIVYGMWMWHERVSLPYFIVLAATMFIMWVTNVGLFWRLLCSDLLRRSSHKRRVSDSQSAFRNAKKSVSNGKATNGSSVRLICDDKQVDPLVNGNTDACFHRTTVQHANGEGFMKNGLSEFS